VLFYAPGSGVRRLLLVAYDGSASAELAVDAALELAGADAVVQLLLLARTAEEAERLSARARGSRTGQAILVSWTGGARRSDLIRAARAASGILVLGAESAVLGEGGAAQLLEEFASSLLIVR
jgi:hypothetical protein